MKLEIGIKEPEELIGAFAEEKCRIGKRITRMDESKRLLH